MIHKLQAQIEILEKILNKLNIKNYSDLTVDDCISCINDEYVELQGKKDSKDDT